MKLRLELGGEAYDVEVVRTRDGYVARCGDLEVPLRVGIRGPPVRLVAPDGDVVVDLPDDGTAVINGRTIPFSLLSYEPGAAVSHNGAHGGTPVPAVMPGRLVRVLVAPGESVVRGQPLFILEAMKMQNELASPAAGRVAEVFAREGDVVEAGRRLALIETTPKA